MTLKPIKIGYFAKALMGLNDSNLSWKINLMHPMTNSVSDFPDAEK
jgi:hypothetical protein